MRPSDIWSKVEIIFASNVGTMYPGRAASICFSFVVRAATIEQTTHAS